MITLYSIGMGKRTLHELLDQLKKHNIRFLIDVRSSPYSRHKPEFNKPDFSKACRQAGIMYDHWPALGGFPESEHVLTQGHVDYKKLSSMPEFQQHLERLVQGAEAGHRIAIMCSEGKPEICHRSKCIGVELEKMNVDFQHIDENNILRTQDEIMQRITGPQTELPGMGTPMVSKRKWMEDNSD